MLSQIFLLSLFLKIFFCTKCNGIEGACQSGPSNVEIHDPFGDFYDDSDKEFNVHNISSLWGSYRPGVYFGMKPRVIDAINFGIQWHSINNLETGGHFGNLRHQADARDKTVYGWSHHDGKNFGIQTIKDPKNRLVITTQWLKEGNHWIARVEGTGKQKKHQSYLFYHYLNIESESEEDYILVDDMKIDSAGLESKIIMVNGQTQSLGEFMFVSRLEEGASPPKETNPLYSDDSCNTSLTHVYGTQLNSNEVWKVSEISSILLTLDAENIFTKVEEVLGDNQLSPSLANLPNWFLPTFPNTVSDGANFIVFQKYLNLPFTVLIPFLFFLDSV